MTRLIASLVLIAFLFVAPLAKATADSEDEDINFADMTWTQILERAYLLRGQLEWFSMECFSARDLDARKSMAVLIYTIQTAMNEAQIVDPSNPVGVHVLTHYIRKAKDDAETLARYEGKIEACKWYRSALQRDFDPVLGELKSRTVATREMEGLLSQQRRN